VPYGESNLLSHELQAATAFERPKFFRVALTPRVSVNGSDPSVEHGGMGVRLERAAIVAKLSVGRIGKLPARASATAIAESQVMAVPTFQAGSIGTILTAQRSPAYHARQVNPERLGSRASTGPEGDRWLIVGSWPSFVLDISQRDQKLVRPHSSEDPAEIPATFLGKHVKVYPATIFIYSADRWILARIKARDFARFKAR
jgi:hypothetical protein